MAYEEIDFQEDCAARRFEAYVRSHPEHYIIHGDPKDEEMDEYDQYLEWCKENG